MHPTPTSIEVPFRKAGQTSAKCLKLSFRASYDVQSFYQKEQTDFKQAEPVAPADAGVSKPAAGQGFRHCGRNDNEYCFFNSIQGTFRLFLEEAKREIYWSNKQQIFRRCVLEMTNYIL